MNINEIKIAWTFDDGPTEYSRVLIDILQELGIDHVTWFVCRHNIYKHDYFQKLTERQRSGDEIAIHEIHPTRESVNWLPGRLACYENIGDTMSDFNIFYDELSSNNLKINFARLPGGELSELIAYLQLLGCGLQEAYHWGMEIIDGNAVPLQYECVKNDYEQLLQCLALKNVKIWSGAPAGFPMLGRIPFHYNSWQAESAGISTGRGADNITLHQAKTRKEARIIEQNFGVFERTLIKVKQTALPGSIVVLAHDTSTEDLEEIAEDIKRMESIAQQNNIMIKYCTMTALFNEIR